MENYSHLSEKDRWEFYKLRQSGIGMTSIARQMNRHRSTLYRELKRNQQRGSRYLPGVAQKEAENKQHKPRQSKIDRHKTLQSYIKEKLKAGWSPEQIAGRLKRKKSKYSICHETIYRYIYRHQTKQWYHYLRYKNPRRYKHYARRKTNCIYGEKRLITQRSAQINSRYQWGHWEGDSVEFSNSKQSMITTLLERKSRFIIMIKNVTKRSEVVMNNMFNALQGLPSKLCRSVTCDQGGEFAAYKILENNQFCHVYYCHTHSPWEKGSNENTNGRLRRFLPRETNIHQVDQTLLDNIANLMNSTPRKCLGYKTPQEILQVQIHSLSLS